MKSSVRQSEVATRVKELLALEARGEVSPKVGELVTEEESPELPEPQERLSALPLACQATRKASKEPSPVVKVVEEEEALLQEMRRERQKEQRAMGPLGVASEKRTTEAMKFDVVPRWLKFSSLPHRLKSQWSLFRTLLEYEMRYKHNSASPQEEGGYFYIGGSQGSPTRTYELLARVVGLQSAETVKKKLRALVKGGYLKMVHAELPRYPQFLLLWEKLKEVYDKEAWDIPFEEGGLEGIPAEFSGTILPTPLHTIWVREGVVNQGMDYALAETMEALKQMGATKKLLQKLLNEHYLGAIRDALKTYEREKKGSSKANGVGKQRPLDVFLGFLKKRTTQN